MPVCRLDGLIDPCSGLAFTGAGRKIFPVIYYVDLSAKWNSPDFPIVVDDTGYFQ